MTSPTVTKPVFEHHHSGLGVEYSRPRISWRFEASESTIADWLQTAYELEVIFASDNKPRTFRETSDQSVLVPWPARDLASRESASVRVRVYGKSLSNDTYKTEEPSKWSASATVEAALLQPKDFQANFITSAEQIGPRGPLRPIRFRKEFVLPEDVDLSSSSARLYITSLGVFEATINGKPVTDECMAPGWTSYRHRLVYRILDVKNLLLPGQKNTICVEVGEGWYAGRLGFKGGIRFRYGDIIGLFAQLEVRGSPCEPWALLSDGTWSSSPSAITNSEIYDGETYDSREETEGWNLTDSKWSSEIGTKILPWPKAKLVAPDAPPVRVTETKPCIKVFRSESNKVILDFGQNLVGKLLIKSLKLDAGEKVTFRHAEVMENGELGTRPLRDAKCFDTIIGSGNELRDWTPKFTFHGFRFVQVDGWPGGAPSAGDIEALVMHTDMRRRGFFECSNPHVNQLHKNVVWSMRGNFLSIPTDCPQRDERLGWTGDLQVFCPTATFLYDTLGILGNWLQDVAAEQLEEGKGGIPPLVVPLAISPNWPHIAQAVWDDVTVLAPSVLYQYSSDKGLLERQFTSMQTWLDQGVDRAPDGLWNPDKWQLSDWLDPTAPPDDPGNGRTDSILVANAYLVHTTLVFSGLCAALGQNDLAAKYAEDAERLKKLFQRRYITAEGNLMSSSQTGLGLAFQFDLYPHDSLQRQTAANALEKLVRTARFRISTGFAGTPVISHALTKIGRPELAYRMLLETMCPSWLYAVVAMGATTIWERWDSMLPDGRINPGQMTSFNHYALGSVADWLHGSVGGISPLEPGWRAIRVRPVPGGNLTSARVSFDGPYGLVSCEWKLEDGVFRMKLAVPPSCSASVTLPSKLRKGFDETDEPIRVVQSGVHDFECPFDAGEWPPKPLIAANQPMPPDTIAA
ncbi:alpha-rhamnosidase [Colletotrichum karsti]|uniref:alpha-L-rhamnosidase n=1 Tax=Colletotrichum karsti TaxID=1095194 RepID=A0A9P6LJ38_9PEZI|nr:alpha-rhamnosidase [Colletotrichum karsti]KAF9875293.1 alpha-rhamnosidase [Colletotrichum karsti]